MGLSEISAAGRRRRDVPISRRVFRLALLAPRRPTPQGDEVGRNGG